MADYDTELAMRAEDAEKAIKFAKEIIIEVSSWGLGGIEMNRK